MDSKTIRDIFTRFRKANPHPTTELIYRSPFELLVAVILSAQATDKSVNKATKPLFQIANTPEKILRLGEVKLRDYVKTIGLYKNKSKHIMGMCGMLVDKYHSKVPKQRAALESLPGVGRKTANVILNTCFGEPTIAVDTHIFRVANRIGLAKAKTREQTELQLDQVIPDQFKLNAHHWLILHGRYVCTARKPKCATCLISDLCEYPDKNL